MKVLLFILLLTFSYAQDNEAAIALLEDLKQQALNELANLQARFEPIREQKLEQISSIRQAKSDQDSECYNRQQDVDNKISDIEGVEEQKQWFMGRQSSNSDRISVLSSNVCQKNNNYIDNIKNARVLLRLIAYLKKALVNLNSQEFVQTKEHVFSEIAHIVNAYKDYRSNKMNKSFLQEMVKQLQPDSEESADLSGTIEQLVEILTQMENEIQEDISNGQIGSIQIGVTFAEFKHRLERENEIFDKQIDVQNNLAEHYERQLIGLQNRVDKCQARLKEISVILLTAEEDLAYDEAFLEEDRQRLLEEIELFEWLIRHYKGEKQPEDLSSEESEEDQTGGQDGIWSIESSAESLESEDDDGEGGDEDNNARKIDDQSPEEGDDGFWSVEDGSNEENSGEESDSAQEEASEEGSNSETQEETGDDQAQETDEDNETSEEIDDRDGVIDYTPLSEQEGAFSDAEYIQLKKKHSKK